MLYPIKVADIELSKPVTTFTGLNNYMGLQGLVRLHGTPIGYINAPVSNGLVDAETLIKLILEKYPLTIINCLLQNGLASSVKGKELRLEDLFDITPPELAGDMPLITVAVCTRNRTTDLDLCLDALCRLSYPNIELIVVDNAPGDNDTELLVRDKYPSVRYVLEPRPGLDWARNRAAKEASGEIIAYTDDDVIVDSEWVKELAKLFAENSEVMAVTGLVVPYELESRVQVLFEMYGGFGRGFERKWHQTSGNLMPWGLLGTGQFGTGANMAFRRSIFDKVGYFDPALDVGTVTNGGGDLEMFFRVLKEGYMLVYEPRAIVRHRHRRDYNKLREQLTNNSKGLLSYCIRSVGIYPEERNSFIKLWKWWLRNWNLGRLFSNCFRPSGFPNDLLLAEFYGCFSGFKLYKKARQNAIEVAKKFGSASDVEVDHPTHQYIKEDLVKGRKAGTAIRLIDISKPLQSLTDIEEYAKVKIFVNWQGVLIGDVDITNLYTSLSISRIIEAIVRDLGFKLLESSKQLPEDLKRYKTITTLQDHYFSFDETHTESLSSKVIVSVVVATYDRPDDLHRCLKHLVAQETNREVEVIVVDNNPASGLTPPVVAEFKEVVLVNENRKGLSYARNAGINASKGEIIISTDDDVIVPSDWVENLITPFVRADVMVVTGNVLPLELETSSQHFFELYGGLGRGFKKAEYDGKWFESFRRRAVPTWSIGACANAAFRASIFANPEIGMIDETLGAGTPTGCSEDTYLFYKVLKLGYTIIYEPKSYVWHKHRTDLKSLKKQIYNYSKGHVSYHLKTWLSDKDWRGIVRILGEVPKFQIRQLARSLLGRSSYPSSLIWLEIKGYLTGPWAYWRSRRNVKRQGRSTPYKSRMSE